MNTLGGPVEEGQRDSDDLSSAHAGDELSDLELLASAARDALDARAAGVLLGPVWDEVAFERVVYRARCQDAARVLLVLSGDAA